MPKTTTRTEAATQPGGNTRLAEPSATRVDRTAAALIAVRTTLSAMLVDDARHHFAWVFMTLLDLGNLSEIADHDQPFRYVVVGIPSLDDVAHLIATVGNPMHVACLELSVLGQVSFELEKANLRFFAIERAA